MRAVRLGVLFLFIFPTILAAAEAEKAATPKLIPDLILCGQKHHSLFHIHKNKRDWDFEMDGPVKDVQPQPQAGTYLVTGGSRRVSLLKRVWKGCQVLWDWKALEGFEVESAAVADWDEKGNPMLVVAADTATPRLFLADARAREPKVRWQFKLPAPPRRVHLCTDNGNFLVTLKDSTVEEILFQEDKVVMTLGAAEGLKDARDAVRDPWAHTYVADAAGGDVFCFGPKKQPLWKTHMPFAPGKFEEMALSLFRKIGKRLLLVSVHYSGGHNVVYVLNSETGNVLTWSDKDDKGGYPQFLKAVPDKAEYYKKQ